MPTAAMHCRPPTAYILCKNGITKTGKNGWDDRPWCMACKTTALTFSDKKSLPCKGRWRDSAGGVGAGHDVPSCMGVKRPRSRSPTRKASPARGGGATAPEGLAPGMMCRRAWPWPVKRTRSRSPTRKASPARGGGATAPEGLAPGMMCRRAWPWPVKRTRSRSPTGKASPARGGGATAPEGLAPGLTCRCA